MATVTAIMQDNVVLFAADHKCVDCRMHFPVFATFETILGWTGGNVELANDMVLGRDFFNGSHTWDAATNCPR